MTTKIYRACIALTFCAVIFFCITVVLCLVMCPADKLCSGGKASCSDQLAEYYDDENNDGVIDEIDIDIALTRRYGSRWRESTGMIGGYSAWKMSGGTKMFGGF